MHVIHIVRDLDVASGGPSRSVPALAESQSSFDGVEVTVLYQDRGNPVVSFAKGKVNYRAIEHRFPFSGDFLSEALEIRSGQHSAHLFHLHGLWNPMLHDAARLARRSGTRYIVSTRGMLANWALGHKALKKKLAWWLYQKKDLAGATAILASSEFEKKDVASLLPHSRVMAIPNGCNEQPANLQSREILPAEQGTRWALAMGRLHPVKGYAELIEAWADVDPPAWKLAIAGPDEAGYRATLEELIKRHRVSDRVVLLGEVDDSQKWSLLDQCELFIAPSKTENFGMAIAEALQSGTPVITTTGTPWQELQGYNCGWWIGPDVDSLILALREATSMETKALSEKGARGHRLIMEKYTWNQVAAKTIELYRSILEGKKHAPCH